MTNTVFPNKFWRPFLDCMPQLFFRPQYVWFPVHLKGHLIPLCYETLVVNWQNWLFTLFHQSRYVLSPNPIGPLGTNFREMNVRIQTFSVKKMYRYDVIKWKHFPHYCSFVRGIHRSPMNSLQRPNSYNSMFSLICAWTHDWVNNRDAGDFRRHHVHHDVTVMSKMPSAKWCPFGFRWPVHAFTSNGSFYQQCI